MNNIVRYYSFLKLDILSFFIIIAIGIFFIFTLMYSLKFMNGRRGLFQYYLYLVLTAFASIGVVLSHHYIALLIFWGFLGLMLYLLINMGDEGANIAAKKTLIIVGGSDALMLFGVCLIYYFTKSFEMGGTAISLNSRWAIAAYLCIAAAAFAKAGAMPFHSWIPEAAKTAPVPVTAYLPAALDKLLGIYLLTRMSLSLFAMNRVMNNFLMLIGAFTIISAVMMALVQHNMKRLLGYHAVSQVGYMILGIGTGNLMGMAGGLFHMLNNAVYKACLFLTAGNVEYRTKTSELDELGGLARFMPVTYVSCLIASLSISGVPPFNGFVSKWMIYQGIIKQMNTGGQDRFIAVICLAAAMFGSGLTLASFTKLLHAVFLGPRMGQNKFALKEVSWLMWVPCAALALICVLFGIFAFALPLRYFVFPAVMRYYPAGEVAFTGVWSPKIAAVLVAAGLFLGLIIFRFTRKCFPSRPDNSFVGGEISKISETNAVTGTDFYNTIKDIGPLGRIYSKAQEGCFDIYEQGKKIFSVSRLLQFLHNGILPTYMVWVLLGMMGLILALVR